MGLAWGKGMSLTSLSLLINRYIHNGDRGDRGLKYGGKGLVLREMVYRGMKRGNNGMRDDNWKH